MARGDLTVFEEFALDIGKELHNFSTDILKFGIINSTVTPTAGDATPTWSDYSVNQVSTTGGYPTGGVALSGVTWTETAGVAKLDDTGNISLAQNASGFTDGYWGILYNSSSASGNAIAFVDLGGPVSEVVGPITVTWAASGILTVTVS